LSSRIEFRRAIRVQQKSARQAKAAPMKLGKTPAGI